MKYTLMVLATKKNCESFGGWARQDLQGHSAFMRRSAAQLGESGELDYLLTQAARLGTRAPSS
jgi:hypothetical protein